MDLNFNSIPNNKIIPNNVKKLDLNMINNRYSRDDKNSNEITTKKSEINEKEVYNYNLEGFYR